MSGWDRRQVVGDACATLRSKWAEASMCVKPHEASKRILLTPSSISSPSSASPYRKPRAAAELPLMLSPSAPLPYPGPEPAPLAALPADVLSSEGEGAALNPPNAPGGGAPVGVLGRGAGLPGREKEERVAEPGAPGAPRAW